MPPRPTMHDVAQLASVSIKTVSRVVNGEAHVDAGTRARVQAVIDTLGFQRNEQARSLRPGQSSALIGLVTGDLGNPFYSAIARGIEDVAYGRGYLLLTGSSEEQADRERRVITAFLQHNVDGLLVVPTIAAHETLTPATLRGVPLVAIDRPVGRVDTFDTVILDNQSGARAAVEALISAGHTRIAMIDGDPSVFTGRERTAGYLHALTGAGLALDPLLIRQGYHGAGQAQAATTALLGLPTPPTAVFATNNRIAVGVLKAMRAGGRHLALASFDDFELSDLLTEPVTVVTYDAVEMGREAARRLFDRLEHVSAAPYTSVIPVAVRPGRDGPQP